MISCRKYFICNSLELTEGSVSKLVVAEWYKPCNECMTFSLRCV